MATEIERKFLVRDALDLSDYPGRSLVQGYLCYGPPTAIRIRMDGDQALLNIKQSVTTIERAEFEYPVPMEDGRAMLALVPEKAIIEKTRHEVPWGGLVWEVDVFAGANAGLVVAEVELSSRDQAIDFPPWVGEEVSGDPRYLNSRLALDPYCDW